MVISLGYVDKGYATIMGGKLPIVALSKLSGEMILLASRIRRHPR